MRESARDRSPRSERTAHELLELRQLGGHDGDRVGKVVSFTSVFAGKHTGWRVRRKGTEPKGYGTIIGRSRGE